MLASDAGFSPLNLSPCQDCRSFCRSMVPQPFDVPHQCFLASTASAIGGEWTPLNLVCETNQNPKE
jgi:hypothetical protein